MIHALLRLTRLLRNLLDQLRAKCSYSPACRTEPMDLSAVREHERNCNENPINKPRVCTGGCGLTIANQASVATHNWKEALRQENRAITARFEAFQLEHESCSPRVTQNGRSDELLQFSLRPRRQSTCRNNGHGRLKRSVVRSPQEEDCNSPLSSFSQLLRDLDSQKHPDTYFG